MIKIINFVAYFFGKKFVEVGAVGENVLGKWNSVYVGGKGIYSLESRKRG